MIGSGKATGPLLQEKIKGGVQVPEELPHAIKGLADYGWYLPAWLGLLGLALALALLLWGAWAWWSKRKAAGGAQMEPQENPLLSLEKRIQALAPPVPFEGKRQSEYFFELNLLFREVVENACRFPATDLTLKELRLPLRSHLPLPYDEVEQVLDFCERAELIKFADARTDIEEARLCHAKVKTWSHTLVVKALTPLTETPPAQSLIES